jgi:hypothetical protein
MMDAKKICGVVLTIWAAGTAAWADSLELKNGSLIKGTFIAGTQTSISFRVGSSVQSYNMADVRSLRFDSEVHADSAPRSVNDLSVRPTAEKDDVAVSSSITIPAGTRISVRTIDDIDSTKNRIGYRFQASLEEPLWVDGKLVVAKGADVYGRLAESKETGTFTGRSELRLELTGIVVNGKTVPLVTGEYQVSGKSKGESTAKRTVGGAAIGSIIGALAGGGKGAAIGAGAGAGLGAGSEVLTEGDQVRIPSETLLDFRMLQSIAVSK